MSSCTDRGSSGCLLRVEDQELAIFSSWQTGCAMAGKCSRGSTWLLSLRPKRSFLLCFVGSGSLSSLVVILIALMDLCRCSRRLFSHTILRQVGNYFPNFLCCFLLVFRF